MPLNSLEVFVALERVPMDNLHRAQRADDVARQPDLAVTAAADLPEQFMIGNDRRRSIAARVLSRRHADRARANTRHWEFFFQA